MSILTRSLPRVAAIPLTGLIVVAGALTMRAQQGAPAGGQAPSVTRPAGWNEQSHGPRTSPDYARLFATDRVHEIRITIPPAQFQQMQEDLKSLAPAGMPGMGPGGPGGPGGRGFDPQQMMALMEEAGRACTGKAENAACAAGGIDGVCAAMFGGPLACVPPQMAEMMRGGAIRLTTRDPIYVPVTVSYGGATWTKVAMRYKGNSSLVTTSGTGNGKVPFRLDFDRYRRDDPAIDGQRFHGFKEVTFSSNFADNSQVREFLAGEVFRDRGVPSPRTAFYRVMVDTGNGPVYWGLYTMVEDPSDGAMLDNQLAGRQGNLYKPDGPGADWTRFDREGFEKKNNERADDFSDVERAVAALHAPRTDAAAWRRALEAAFDVDGFLRWLAVNTAIDNWDTYGAMAHNYYLYGNPGQGGRLQWLPWDNNMAFGVNPMGPGGGRGGFGPPPGFGPRGGAPPQGAGPRGGFPPGPGGPGGPPPGFAGMFPNTGDVLHRSAGPRWPLLQILLDDEVYAARYRDHLRRAIEGGGAADAVLRRARELHALVRPFVTGPNGEQPTHTTLSDPGAFNDAIDGPGGLAESLQRRHAAIRAALETAR